MLSANNDAVGEGLDSLARLAGDLSGAARRAGEDAGRLEGGFVAGIQAAAQKADGAARKIQATTTDIRDIARREEADFVLTVPLIKPLFVPSPQKVAGTFFNLLSEEFSGGTLWRHTWDSVRRVFLGFLLAILLAVPIGVLMGINRHMRGFWDPPIEFYRPIPPLAYLPLMIVWFGIGEEPKVLLIFLAIFAPVVINSRAGVRSVAIEADSRGVFNGGDEDAGDLACDFEGGDAGDFDGDAYRGCVWVDDIGRGGVGGGAGGLGRDDKVGVGFSGDGCDFRRHLCDCGDSVFL